MSTEILSGAPRRFGEHNFNSQRLGHLRRGSLACISPIVQYTSSSTLSHKRPFSVNDENDVSSGYISSPSTKRARSVLKDSNRAIDRNDSGRGYDSDSMLKHNALGEKRGVISITGLAGSHSAPKAQGSVKIFVDSKEVRKCQLPVTKRAPSSSLHKRRSPSSTPSSSPKRLNRKRTFSRIEPASSKSESGSGVLLHRAVERARAMHSSSPKLYNSDESDGGVVLTHAAPFQIPVSWQFDIYEDTPEDVMQNMMEHSTGILDISDDSDDEKCKHDEIVFKGKENISPERMRELMAEKDAMEIDDYRPVESKTQITGATRKVFEEKRESLKELDVKEFYPSETTDGTSGDLEKKEAPSTISSAEFGSKSSDFEVWASGGETDDESDGERGVPLPLSIKGKDKAGEDDEESVCGASDKEN